MGVTHITKKLVNESRSMHKIKKPRGKEAGEAKEELSMRERGATHIRRKGPTREREREMVHNEQEGG
jgi:hypothetical protein